MEVLCACDDRFVPHTATMLCSLLEHNPGCRVHLFHSPAASPELLKLTSFVANYGSNLVLYSMRSDQFDNLRIDDHASAANYYRLIAPDILPADLSQILYLDSDIIVRRSLTSLWNINLDDYALAAVEDPIWALSKMNNTALFAIDLPIEARYFNTGVMLINLSYWRDNSIGKQAIEFIKNYPTKVNFWDQDALNVVLIDRWINIPSIWNAQHQHVADIERVADPAIVHYSSSLKPWHWSWCNVDHPYKYEYQKYRRKTPWRNYCPDNRPNLLYRSMRVPAKLVLSADVRRWLRLRIEDFGLIGGRKVLPKEHGR